MEVQKLQGLTINAPAFFDDPAFMAWLNGSGLKFTWHIRGNSVADDYSDVVVSVDPTLSGEGPDSDMPDYIWRQIVDACREHIGPQQDVPNYLVRITNLRG